MTTKVKNKSEAEEKKRIKKRMRGNAGDRVLYSMNLDAKIMFRATLSTTRRYVERFEDKKTVATFGLVNAVVHGSLEKIKYLVEECGADIGYVPLDREDAIFRASQYGRENIWRYLLKKKEEASQALTSH